MGPDLSTQRPWPVCRSSAGRAWHVINRQREIAVIIIIIIVCDFVVLDAGQAWRGVCGRGTDGQGRQAGTPPAAESRARLGRRRPSEYIISCRLWPIPSGGQSAIKESTQHDAVSLNLRSIYARLRCCLRWFYHIGSGTARHGTARCRTPPYDVARRSIRR